MEALRNILLGCGLTEELKWGSPCYTHAGGNVVMIGAFKEYCALMLFKGALLRDPEGLLVRAGENTQSGRQIRLTSVRQITGMKKVLQAYLRNAVEVEASGLKVAKLTEADLVLPEEFVRRCRKQPALKKAFDALTPGRRRAYAMHFSSARQEKTREARIDACTPRILAGKGLDDRWEG